MRLAILTGIAMTLAAQQAAPQFDVASLKHEGDVASNVTRAGGVRSSGLRPLVFTPTSFSCKTTLLQIFTAIYDVKNYQVQAPDWFDREVYEIDARMPGPTSRETARQMLEALLVERLGLKVHRQTKETPVLVLVAIPGSDKLEEVTPAPESPQIVIAANGLEARPATTLASLVSILWRNAGRPVLDETGRTGYYKVKLLWSEDGGPAELGASMISALPQAGLKVESAKRSLEYIIVDQISKEPAGN
ncbi:MAG TPA: TIGR03435 family protein [Candidatus Limnocylindrales bacterium]|nr:TIGR03435 family protein [Candidatus Limnocylindrales bacterium]